MKKIITIIILVLMPTLILAKNLEWKKVDISIQGRLVNIIPIDSTRQLLLSDQGLFLYRNFSLEKNIGDSIIKYGNILDILINENKEIIVATRGDGIFKYDYAKWIDISFNIPTNLYYSLEENNQGDIIAVCRERLKSISYVAILKSNSKTWNIKKVEDDFIFGEIFKFMDRHLIYNSYNKSLYVSVINDDSIEWEKLTTASFLDDPISIQVFDNKIYIYKEKNFKVYDIEKKAWEEIGSNLLKFQFQKVLVTKKGELIVYSSVGKGIYYSNDGGYNFERNDDGIKDIQIIDIKVLEDGKILLINNLNEFYVSDPPKNIEYSSNLWSDRITYKDLIVNHAKDSKVDQFGISKDGNTFYTVYDNNLYSYDVLTGKFINSKSFESENAQIMKIYIKDKTVSVLRVNYDETNYEVRYKVNVHDIDNLNIIKEYTVDDILPECSELLTYYFLYSFSIDNNSNEDKLFLNLTYDIGCDTTTNFRKLNGKLYEIDFSIEPISHKIIYDIPLKNYYFLEPDKIIMHRTNSMSEFKNETVETVNSNDILIAKQNTQDTTYLLQDVDRDFENKNYREIISVFDFNNHNQIIAWSKNYYIFRWNLSDYSLIDSIKLDKRYESIAISNDLKYCVAARSNGINIFTFPDFELVHNEEIQLFNTGSKIQFLPDKRSFLVATNLDIRLFDIAKLTHVEDYDYSNIIGNLSLSPNPAKDFININYNYLGGFENSEVVIAEIYDLMGVKIQSMPIKIKDLIPLNHQIDVSNLTTGIYLLKIGEKVEKFVKY